MIPSPEARQVPKRPRVPKIRCRFCGEWDSRVVDGRPARDGYKRKRRCETCHRVFFTMERAA